MPALPPGSGRRRDDVRAKLIDAAIQVNTLWGCVAAWRYLRVHGVHQSTAQRVLARDGRRRATDTVHVAVRDAQERSPDTGIGHRAAAPGAAADTAERTNDATAAAVEHAIGRLATEGRHYAEGLLRLHGVHTNPVMRVLFEPHRRRRQRGQA
jgi:hypothetical protein